MPHLGRAAGPAALSPAAILRCRHRRGGVCGRGGPPIADDGAKWPPLKILINSRVLPPIAALPEATSREDACWKIFPAGQEFSIASIPRHLFAYRPCGASPVVVRFSAPLPAEPARCQSSSGAAIRRTGWASTPDDGGISPVPHAQAPPDFLLHSATTIMRRRYPGRIELPRPARDSGRTSRIPERRKVAETLDEYPRPRTSSFPSTTICAPSTPRSDLRAWTTTNPPTLVALSKQLPAAYSTRHHAAPPRGRPRRSRLCIRCAKHRRPAGVFAPSITGRSISCS